MKRKSLALILSLIMMFSAFTPLSMYPNISAAGKISLRTKKITTIVGKSAAIRFKNKGKAVIEYRSTKPGTASVSSTGKITGLKKGKTKIQITAKQGTKTTKLVCNVNILKGAKKITIQNKSGKKIKSVTLLKRKKVKVQAAFRPAKSDVVKWSSSDKNIASVTSKGVIKGNRVGSARIIAKTLTKKRAVLKVKVTAPPITAQLKNAYAKDFSIGTAVSTSQFQDSASRNLITSQFNSITMENEMKPNTILDQVQSAKSTDNITVKINTKKLDEIFALAKKYNLKLRGHCLIWHSQTPDWFFKNKFDGSEKLVSADIMLKRMESYIKQVMEYCQTKYPGILYAWDVVNEAVADNKGDSEGYRNTGSPWYDVFGNGSFVEKAFEYANKYKTEDVKLFYNDYNAFDATKSQKIYNIAKKLYDKGYLDGVGMQAHYPNIGYPPITAIETAIKKYASIGKDIEIQLTELDIHNASNSAKANKALGNMYQSLFRMLVRLDRAKTANITNVTFWGLTDDVTWLTNFKQEKSYPLLFEGDFTAKDAFYRVIEASKS